MLFAALLQSSWSACPANTVVLQLWLCGCANRDQPAALLVNNMLHCSLAVVIMVLYVVFR
jgi:hypothetical protein